MVRLSWRSWRRAALILVGVRPGASGFSIPGLSCCCTCGGVLRLCGDLRNRELGGSIAMRRALEEDAWAPQNMLDPVAGGGSHRDTEASVGNGSILLGASSLLPHRFSIRQMKSMVCICDTFVASLNYYDTVISSGEEKEADPSLSKDADVDEMHAYYQLSASEAGVPEFIAGLMNCRLKPPILQIISWVLWLLSTRLGTFLMCGRGSLSNSFPYFLSFPMISFPGREQILLKGWADSDWVFFRVLFKIFKSYTMHGMYSKVNHVYCNMAWKAIGYCGPDPVATTYRKSFKAKPEPYKPLHNKVIDVQSTNFCSLHPILESAGFAVLEDASHLARLWSPKGGFSGGKPVGIKCDVVVVGSGSGGGVAAGVLAQAGFKVLVLEKGKYFAREDLSLLEGPSLQHMYEEGCLLSTKDGSIAILAGSTVGGGSTLNWAASFPTPPSVLAEWEKEHKLSMFSSTEYQTAMSAVCTRLGVQGSVERENLQNTILRKGCEELGYHVETVSRNSQPDHFCGWCGLGCWDGNKQATSETWLVDATRSGAIILAGCNAIVALHKENSESNGKRRKAVGVVAWSGAEHLFIEARVTIVACGSFQTPPLLLRSGLQNANIGKNLHLHPVQMVWGFFPKDKGPEGNSYEGGIITAVCKEVINLNPPNYGCILQNPSLHPGSFSVLMPWLSGLDHKQAMTRYARTVHVFALARDKGSGKVGPKGDIDYVLQDTDEENLKEGADRALRVLIAAGAEEVGTHHQDGDRLKLTGAGTAEIERFLRRVRSKALGKLRVPMCSAHQLSSCRMGSDAASSAVDPKGETWEVEGLFVADASVVPTAIGVNPMITVQSLAYCTAQNAWDFLKQGHRH